MKFKVPSQIRGSNISAVVEDLKGLHDALCSVEQEQFGELRGELTPVAARLADAELLKNGDKTVKLLTACCVANVLKLFAPDAPYDAEQLKDIFALMLQQFKGLADEKNVYQNYVFYLVESLATVKSVILLLDIDDTHGDRERLLQQLFGLLFDLAPLPHISRTVKLYLLEIGQTLLDESDALSSDLVRCIAQRCGDVRGETRAFAGELVRLCADKLQPSLGLFFNEAILRYTGGDDNGDGGSKRLEPLKLIHAQMIQVGQAAPSAIASVVAQMEDELHAADQEVRMLALGSLATFFGTPALETWKLYTHTWQAWLNKINDRIAGVRLSWVRHALNMLPALDQASRAQVVAGIGEKLQDVDAKVREKTVGLMSHFLETGSAARLLGADICAEVGERCRDKTEEVRNAAISLLCELVHAHYGLDPNSHAFSTCVNSLFKLIYTNDRDLRIFYEYYIEHSVAIPRGDKKIDIQGHAIFLASVYRVMGEEARKAFKKWLNDKSLFVRYLDVYLKIAGARPDDPRLAPLNQHLSNLFRAPLRALAMLQALPPAIAANGDVRTHLETIVKPETGMKKQRDAVAWIMNKNWGQGDARIVNELMQFLARRASLLSVNGDLVTAVLAITDRDLQVSGKKLVAEIIAEFPALGVKHADLLENSIRADPQSIDNLTAYARLVAASGGRVGLKQDFAALLKDSLGGERRQAKYAAKILASFPETKAWLREGLNEYIGALEGQHAIHAWQVLAELGNHPDILDDIPRIQAMAKVAIEEVCAADRQFPEQSTLSLSSHAPAEVCAVLAVRCIRNMLLALQGVSRERGTEHLRVVAPLMVEWLDRARSPRVGLAISKALLLLVPRPTATTLVTNLAGVMKFAEDAPLLPKERLLATIMRQYHLEHVGMLYLLLPIMFTESSSARAFKEAFATLRKNDRYAEAVLPLDDVSIEINSRNLHRYEDLFVLCIVVAGLHPTAASSEVDEATLARFNSLAELLVDLVATELNVSYLFDAVVQLKRLKYVTEQSSGRLYVLSEIAQNALRTCAHSRRWALQAVKSAISITDELLLDLPAEESGRNVNKGYLVRATSKIERTRRSDESMRRESREKRDENTMDLDNVQQEDGPSVETTPTKMTKRRRSERNKSSSTMIQ